MRLKVTCYSAFKEPILLPLPAILHGMCRYFCVASYQRVKYWCEVTPCTPYILCLLSYIFILAHTNPAIIFHVRVTMAFSNYHS